MQNNYWSLWFVSKLQRMQITTLIGDIVCYPSILKNMKKPNQTTLEARAFYEKNMDSVKDVLSMFADKKSKDVYKNVIAFRMGKALIKKELYSLWDQYFCKDIICLQDGEVFVDGGAYVGDTIGKFLKEARKQNVQVRRVVAFEPGNNNYKILRKKFAGGGYNCHLDKKRAVGFRKTFAFFRERILVRSCPG